MSTITNVPALPVDPGAAGLVSLIVSLVMCFQSKAINFEFRTIGERLDRAGGKFANLDQSIGSLSQQHQEVARKVSELRGPILGQLKVQGSPNA